MKRTSLVLSLLFTTVCFSRTFYFSSSTGSDLHSESAAQNADTPWKTLSKLNAYFSRLRPGDSVLFKRGDVFSGSISAVASGANNAPIVIAAYGKGKKPVIKGTVVLSNWKSTGNGIWECYTPTLDAYVKNLMINHTPQELGRWPNSDAPNKGYLTVNAVTEDKTINDDKLLSSHNWIGAEVVVRKQRWKLERSRIISQVGNTITFKGSGSNSATAGFGYFIQNDIKTLDRFGEWYYNHAANKVYVFLGSKNPSSLQIEVTVEAVLFSAMDVSYITINGLQFWGANNDAIAIVGGSNITLQRCDVFSAGRYGFNVSNHSRVSLDDCSISFANEGGIKISGDYAQVRRNRIENTGIFAGMGQPKGNGLTAIYCSSLNGLIEYNYIKNTGYIGIQFKQDSVTIQHNVVDSFCLVTDDGGGIYAHNPSKKQLKGRKILKNIVINGIGAQQGTRSTNSAAEGIYMDDNTNGVAITENTVANNGGRGIYLHNSHDIVVAGNTVYNNTTQFFTRHDNIGGLIRNCTIVRNIFFSPRAEQYLAQHYSTADDINNIGRFDSNSYCRPFNDNNIIKVYVNRNEYYSLDAWKGKVKMEENSSTTPVQFSAPTKIQFEYNPTSIAKSISLDGTYIDVFNRKYKQLLTLQPFTSVILKKISK